MITKSIERAQKKVEENNFGIRKRLLEYDDVMNSQREVIYKRRRNALYGERLQLDIMNMLYDTSEDIILNTKGVDDYDSFKLTVLGVLGFDYPISQEEFHKISTSQLTNDLYSKTYDHYKQKNENIAKQAFPIIKDVFETRGATVKNIMVPFSDGKRQIGVESNLERNIETNCREMIISMEKAITLSIIDMLWKDHLREMDDLKQSVQNAVYEQKDPLLIYKFEAFQLFKRFIAKVNEETISFLIKANLPVRDTREVQEARQAQQRQQQQRLKEQKEESGSLLGGGGNQTTTAPNQTRTQVQEKVDPAKSDKMAGRNDRVSVQYADGTIKKNVKFKTVEEDIKASRCMLIEA